MKQLNITDECIKQELIKVSERYSIHTNEDIVEFSYYFAKAIASNGKHEVLKSYADLLHYYKSLDISETENGTITCFVTYILKKYKWAWKYVHAFYYNPDACLTRSPLCTPKIKTLKELGELILLPMYPSPKERNRQNTLKDDKGLIYIGFEERVAFAPKISEYLTGYQLYIKPSAKLSKIRRENTLGLIEGLGSLELYVQTAKQSVLIANSACLIGSVYMTCFDNNILLEEIKNAKKIDTASLDK